MLPLSRRQDGLSGVLARYTMPILTALFAVGLGLVASFITGELHRNDELRALHEARQLSRTLEEFRSLYTSEVVARVAPLGVRVSHDYAEHPGAIPLPATLSIALGERIGAFDYGAKAALYSPFPFPASATTGGLRTPFQEAAWVALNAEPEGEFFRFEEVNGAPVLRLARADRMRPACVGCHNSHPETPKADWRDGDVRGVLEVILPMERVQKETRESLRLTFGLLASVSLLALLATSAALRGLRRNAEELEQEVAERTSQLRALGGDLLRAEAKERERIAGVLHDHLQQLIVSARMRTDVVASRATGEDAVELGRALETLREACLASRELSVDLDPPLLREEGVGEALPALARQLEDHLRLAVTVHVTVAAEPRIEVAQFLLRAARELLFNVAKHAATDAAEVKLHCAADRCDLWVRDTGVGFESEVAGRDEGFGLPSLRQRARFLGGDLVVRSVPCTEVHLWVVVAAGRE